MPADALQIERWPIERLLPYAANRTEFLRLWPTPRASAGENRQASPTPSQAAGRHGMNLAASAASWPAPEAPHLWGTPSAADAEGGRMRRSGGRSDELLLKGQAAQLAELWATPTARDHKDGATTLANTPVNGLLGRQVLRTSVAGASSCAMRRTLNPLFVEALMGWPSGWTDPGSPMRCAGASTGCGSAATEWSRWLRRMRSELSRLSSPHGGERAQMELP